MQPLLLIIFEPNNAGYDSDSKSLRNKPSHCSLEIDYCLGLTFTPDNLGLSVPWTGEIPRM